jgi:serine phosphatase RsbU (regulator of sigma subunit)
VNEYQQLRTRLEFGDMIVLYSNSLVESLNRRGSALGAHGLLDRIRQFDVRNPEAIGREIVQGVRREHDGNLRCEDATICVCQGSPAKVPWKDNFLAPMRLFRPVSDQTRFH